MERIAIAMQDGGTGAGARHEAAARPLAARAQQGERMRRVGVFTSLHRTTQRRRRALGHSRRACMCGATILGDH